MATHNQRWRAFNQHEQRWDSGEVFIFKSTIHFVFLCSIRVHVLARHCLVWRCAAWSAEGKCMRQTAGKISGVMSHKQCTLTVNRLCALINPIHSRIVSARQFQFLQQFCLFFSLPSSRMCRCDLWRESVTTYCYWIQGNKNRFFFVPFKITITKHPLVLLHPRNPLDNLIHFFSRRPFSEWHSLVPFLAKCCYAQLDLFATLWQLK